MTLVNTRAAFEKAVTDAVANVDPTVEMVYDNMIYKTPGKNKGRGTASLSSISEAVIDGLTSVNSSDYTDTFSCSPRVLDVVGPAPIELDDSAHFLGLISCQFTANA